MILTRGFSFLMEHLTHLTPKTSFVVNKQKADNAEEILILDVTLDADQYILINLYNTETKQLKIFQEIQSLLKFLTSIKRNGLCLQVISISSLIQN